jgi:hypothetical protein
VDRQYPGVHLLFACRPLDYSQRLDAGRHTCLPEIEVQAMEPERIQAFIGDLIPANLALAGRCAAQPDLKISEGLRGALRKLC